MSLGSRCLDVDQPSGKAPWLVLVLVVGGLCLPFVFQAFHVDDRIYLATADHIREHPWFPYDYPLVFEGVVAQDMASHSHLPLTSYLLALVQALSGSDQEWIYHVVFMVFPLIAAFSFWDIARRFVRHALAATLIFLVAPAFTVLSHTIMPDVPLLAFWLLAMRCFLKITSGLESPSDRWFLLLALLAAGFISLLTAGLLLLMISYLLLRWRAGLPTHSLKFLILAMLSPLLLWIGWYTSAFFHYRRMVLATVLLYVKNERAAHSWDQLALKTVSFILNSGGAFFFPVLIWYGFFGRFKTRIAVLSFLAAFTPFYLFVENWAWPQILLFALFFSSGTLVFYQFLTLLRESRPEMLLLFLWFFGIFTSCLVLYFSGSVRYALLALPPTVLLWVRSLEEKIGETYLVRNLLATGLILTALYSALISYTDYRFAGVYKRVTAELYEKYSKHDQTIWFTGEWGFRYYLERRGGKILTRTSQLPRKGDIIVKPYLATPWVTLYDGDPGSLLLEQRFVEEPLPLRLMDFSSHAGFYSTGWGLLPISVSTGEPWEWFNVFRVEREYTGPPPEELRWW